MSVIPEINGRSQVIMQPEAQVAIPIVSNPRTNNNITLSQNMKLRIDHNGIVEIESTFASAREYTEVTCTEALATQYGLADEWIGETISISVEAAANTFPLASTSTGDTDLTPANDAMEEDENDFNTTFYKNLPGKMGGPAMTDRNFLTGSAEQTRGAEVPGDFEDELSSSTSI